MNKILLIVEREYLSRVTKKSFLIMSIAGPLLIAAFYGVIIYFAVQGGSDKKILVSDQSGFFVDQLGDVKKVTFAYTQKSLEDGKAEFLSKSKEYDAFLYIPAFLLEKPEGIMVFSEKGLSIETESSIDDALEQVIEQKRLEAFGIEKQKLAEAKFNVKLISKNLSQEGEKDSNAAVATIVGIIAGVVIYMFVFLYGVQVMRGVLEEKTNRIVEVVISSVKPFELMMGKVLGIAGVGLTQLTIWIVLGFVTTTAVSSFVNISPSTQQEITQQMVKGNVQQEVPNDIIGGKMLKALATLDYSLIIGSFLFYFLFGYLMYAAMFGAIGSAVDNETDTQQFMLPVTIPLVMSIAMSSVIMADPNGPLAFWMSMIPLTSPVVMMIRLPYIGFGWELLLSMALLVGGFLGVTWLAARIYRVGILMYGKKPSYKELGKWIFMKH